MKANDSKNQESSGFTLESEFQVGDRIACFGGLYSNYLALQAAIDDAKSQQISQMYCLGDLGAFGPYPDRVFPILAEHKVLCVQGNYDDSIGNHLDDCQCGYTDPRDNHFAKISYDYTLANTSEVNRQFLKTLPKSRTLRMGNSNVLLCHGSPRQTNEFLWESATSSLFLNHLCDQYQCDVMVGTHSGIKWQRDLGDGRLFVNVGVLGRPENDGQLNVWYALLTANANGVSVEFRPVEYDHQRLANEMQAERLPQEFVETVLTGYWTTCLEVLPGKERLAGKH